MSPRSIEATKAALAQDFADLSDWTDRYQYLIDLGRSLPAYPDRLRQPVHILPGCQAKVWLAAECLDGRLHFYAESDSALVAGLLAVLVSLYDDQRPEAILADGSEFFHALGLEEFLSPHRRNGLAHMLDRIHRSAGQCQQATHHG